MTDRDINLLHADIQRLREQISGWVRWGIALIAGTVIVASVGSGMTLARLSHVETQALEARRKAEQTAVRVGNLERAQGVTDARFEQLKSAINDLTNEVREVLARERGRNQ